MRVLFITHELALNGAVIAMLEQVRFLSGRGHLMTIAAPKLDTRTGALVARFESAGARITNSCNPSDHDIAVGCTVFAVEHLQYLLGRMPVVWRIHEGLAGVRYVLSHPAGLHVLSDAHTLVFPSHAIADQLYAPLLSAPPLQRIDIVPGIVPPPAPGTPAAKPANTVRILCVGTVSRRKRQADLV